MKVSSLGKLMLGASVEDMSLKVVCTNVPWLILLGQVNA